MSKKIIVSGVGCCLVDLLYNDIDFNSDIIRPFLSKKRGDGGLTPGNLVFQEEFEKYSEISFDRVLYNITGGRAYDQINIGGPSIVSLINLAQLIDINQCEVRFYGHGGKDETGQYLLSSLNKTPVLLKDYKMSDRRCPSTVVLSDPSYDEGHGERMFINSIGASWKYNPDELDEDFFNSDIVVFGGTALVPQIHDDINNLLKKAKLNGFITIVNTVFDFRNVKANPLIKWPMGESDESYKYIDLLITDREEALGLSGEMDINSAIRFFRDKKVSSLIITNGSKNISIYSDGLFFTASELKEMPVSLKVTNEIKSVQHGDTTGCGDNFAGGVMASIVSQLNNGNRYPDIQEACCWGIISGGFACFYMGGTYFEENPGEKRSKLESYYEAYRRQIAG